jgi:uncharacterized protein (DUF433 family)
MPLSPGYTTAQCNCGTITEHSEIVKPTALANAARLLRLGLPVRKSRKVETAGRSLLYGAVMNYQGIITIEPGKRGGRPCVRGMRISVADVLGWLAAGMSPQQISADYPELTDDDIRGCLAYAADRERRH